jgi:hypothetical protein
MVMFPHRPCLFGLLSFLPSALSAETVEVHFDATAQTVVGMPFGISLPRLTTATGAFFYESATTDTNPSTDRGDYPHAAGGGFVMRFLDQEITGSATPFVQVENLSSDTFRLIDGPRIAGNQGGMMKQNGVEDSTAQLLIAISKSGGDAFGNDDLPVPFPFYYASSFPVPHTFSLKNDGGTILFQFNRTFPVNGPVIERVIRETGTPLVILLWRGRTGVAHRIEFSEDLKEWMPLGADVTAVLGQNSFEDRLDLRYAEALPAEVFYRIRAL